MTLNNETLRISIHSIRCPEIQTIEPPQISINIVTLTQAARFETIFTSSVTIKSQI